MSFDETVAVFEVLVPPSGPFVAEPLASPWTSRPCGRRFDEPGDPVGDGPRQIANNVVFGYD
jgi:hypothetical protein